MPVFRLIACAAAVGVLAGCSNRPAPTEPPTASPSRAPLLQQKLTTAPTGAARAATNWALAYCGWSYQEANGQREINARALMTASAAAELSTTPNTTWSVDVVATQQVATCADVATHALEGPPTPTTVFLLITADRTVTDATGAVVTSAFVEPRRMVLADGRWLVDTRVEGG